MIKFEEYDYYIKPGYTDLRRGALKLSLIVQDEMEMNPFSKAIFMFCSKNRNTGFYHCVLHIPKIIGYFNS